jgi:cytochrome c553
MAKFLLLTISRLVFLSANFERNIRQIDVTPAESITMVIQADSVKTCQECHADLLKEETVHAPAKKKCERCHEPNGNEHPLENVVAFSIAEGVPNLCYGCLDP